MIEVRRYRDEDRAAVWGLNALPNIGLTADPTVPLELAAEVTAPQDFPDLADIPGCYLAAGGDFLVAQLGDHIVGMGAIRPTPRGQAEVVRVRVHSATRRRGVGRALMNALERRAVRLGFRQVHLNTATNQPEALAFYLNLGYGEVGREHQASWSWTLVYFAKSL